MLYYAIDNNSAYNDECSRLVVVAALRRCSATRVADLDSNWL